MKHELLKLNDGDCNELSKPRHRHKNTYTGSSRPIVDLIFFHMSIASNSLII